jgi:hypothetical protein
MVESLLVREGSINWAMDRTDNIVQFTTTVNDSIMNHNVIDGGSRVNLLLEKEWIRLVRS